MRREESNEKQEQTSILAEHIYQGGRTVDKYTLLKILADVISHSCHTVY